MKERFWQMRYRMRGVWFGIKGMGRIQLGSRVFHDGKWWFVSNWAHEPYVHLSQGGRWGSKSPYREYVPRAELRPSRLPSEYIHRFRVMYRWYMDYWWVSDVYKAVSHDH